MGVNLQCLVPTIWNNEDILLSLSLHWHIDGIEHQSAFSSACTGVQTYQILCSSKAKLMFLAPVYRHSIGVCSKCPQQVH